MYGKEHVAFGIASSAALALTFYNPESAYFSHPFIMVGTAILGSIAPDIDSPRSTISERLPVISKLVCEFMGHRTYMHDIALWGVLLVLIYLKFPIMFGFFIGYMGHLLLDSMTTRGVPWLYLIHKKQIKSGKNSFKNGIFHLLPKPLRFHSSSVIAKLVTMSAVLCIIAASKYFFGNVIFINLSKIIGIINA